MKYNHSKYNISKYSIISQIQSIQKSKYNQINVHNQCTINVNLQQKYYKFYFRAARKYIILTYINCPYSQQIKKIIFIFIHCVLCYKQYFFMNDFKTTLTKKQQIYLSRMLPKGYSFELFKVRKNIIDYPVRQLEKKYKKAQSIIMSKKQSVMQSIQQSEQSYRQKSEQQAKFENYNKLQTQCLNMLKKLKKHQSSYPFKSPVDPKALQIPDYFDVVIEPIDLKTIQQIIKRNEYEHISQFQRDIYKMIMNSYKYNQQTSSTYSKTIQFEELFVTTLKDFYANNGQQNQNENKQNIKQQIEEQQKYTQYEEIKDQFIFIPKEINVVNQPKPVPQIKDKPSKTGKIGNGGLTAENTDKPKYSRKSIPKNIAPPKIQQREVKVEQPEDPFFPELIASQTYQSKPEQKVDYSQQMIKEQFKSYLQNETQNNKQQIFSQGYNEFTCGGRIPHTQVQKQITGLLKRLNQYPLTKQKKHKPASKFNNLQQNMTQTDKKKLYEKIFKLDQNDIDAVINILVRGKTNLLKQTEFQIDIDKVDNKVLKEIQNFVSLRENVTYNVQPTTPLDPQLSNNQQLSNDIGKANKKMKKQEKKALKKKLSRKNSADQSFSINPPPPKKKKHQRSQKLGDKKKSIKPDTQQYRNQNQQVSESSYHPQNFYQSSAQANTRAHQTSGTNNNFRAQEQQNNANNNNLLYNIQYPIMYSNNNPSQQAFNNNNNSIAHHQNNVQHNQHQLYDIEQFLVPSNHRNDNDNYGYNHHNEESVPLSHRSSRGMRINSLYHLDMIQDHNFHLGNSAHRGYIGDDQIRQYSMQDPQSQNDEDEFF